MRGCGKGTEWPLGHYSGFVPWLMACVAPVCLSTTTSFQDRRAWWHSLSEERHERVRRDLLPSGRLTLVVGQPVNFQNSYLRKGRVRNICYHPLGSTPAPQFPPCPSRSSLNYN